jgi:hypothetical protein
MGGTPCNCGVAEICDQGSFVDTCDDCGFELGDLSEWDTQDLTDPFHALESAPAGVTSTDSLFASEPTEGSKALVHGFDGDGPGTIEVGQDVTLAAASNITLSFDYRAGWNIFDATSLDRTFVVEIQPAGGRGWLGQDQDRSGRTTKGEDATTYPLVDRFPSPKADNQGGGRRDLPPR